MSNEGGDLQDIKAEFEYQYSPSRWSKRMSPEAVIDAHVSFATEASEKARQSVPYECMRYGERENQSIDLYGTSLPNDSPVLVYVHGGYWKELQRSISAYLVKPLVKNGIRVAVVGYDLVPTVTFDDIVTEMQELDKFLNSWVEKNEAKEIWYAGHSAGAYLIASILKNRVENDSMKGNFPITGMVFISGIYDLVPLVGTYVNDDLKLTRSEAERRCLREIGVKKLQTLKSLVVVAENDSDAFRRQSQDFHQMLVRQNSNSEFMLIKGKDHFDVVEQLVDEHYELTRKIIGLILKK